MLDVAAMAAGGPDLRAGVGAVSFCRADGAGAATGGDSAAPALSRPGAVVLETHSRERHEETIRLLAASGLGVERETFDGPTGMVYASRAR